MSMTRIKSLFAGSVAGIALLGAVGSAQAATYAGSWDPAFGTAFPNLYWTANGTFDVPDTCLALADGVWNTGTACGGLSVTSMTISFYDGTGGVKGSFIESFSTSLAPAGLQSVVVANHQFVGINTNYFNSVTPSAFDTQAGGGTYGFALNLFYTGTPGTGTAYAALEYFKPADTSTICQDPAPKGTLGQCGFSQYNAVGTITAVPEPGTYALLGAGLGVIGLIARRRRA